MDTTYSFATSYIRRKKPETDSSRKSSKRVFYTGVVPYSVDPHERKTRVIINAGTSLSPARLTKTIISFPSTMLNNAMVVFRDPRGRVRKSVSLSECTSLADFYQAVPKKFLECLEKRPELDLHVLVGCFEVPFHLRSEFKETFDTIMEIAKAAWEEVVEDGDDDLELAVYLCSKKCGTV